VPGAATEAEPSASVALALVIHNLSKTFGGQRALASAGLEIRRGEVHGLLGQNGSGKSTLIKILAGYHAPDPGGRLLIDGGEVELPLEPGEFRRYGISFVHQNLGLIPSLTVVENLFVGELASRLRWGISWERERRRAAAIFAKYGLSIDPATTVAKLPSVQRALLAIVRAVEEMRSGDRRRRGQGLLVLDEPTPFLPQHDVEELFALVRGIVHEGASVMFVSHDVDEVLAITDRATVLRDGVVAGTLITRESTRQEFVEMIVGRRVETVPARPQDFGLEEADTAIEGLSGGTLEDLSIQLHRGEVVGLTGLIGSGFDEVPYLVFGSRPAEAGRLKLRGAIHDLADWDPARAMDANVVLIPGDRQNAGAVASLTIADNVTVPVLSTEYRAWMLNRRDMSRRAGRLARQFDVTPSDPSLPFEALSGGNQQKVLLAKWLQMRPDLILLDEPTQGVDVGARQKVFTAIREAAGAGAAVVCASSDYEQLATICDRVLIFSRGRVVSELIGSAISKELIAEHCYLGSGRPLEREAEARAAE
jgi:ribose transport system ATP-binding protein